jgi:hypothetical protein
MKRALLVFAIGCGATRRPSTPPAAPLPKTEAPPSWPVPEGWKRETIPFPLEFAPSLAHRGVEELRFPPGFLKDSPNRWSYAFEWAITDEADLDATQLAAELVTYFRGLLVAVDGDKRRFDPDKITAIAEKRGDTFAVKAFIFDAFGAGNPVALEGTAKRTSCGPQRTVWRFVLAPAVSPIRAELDALAARAVCE